MAKTKIIFNNKNYNIDEASFATATTALKSHLSTVMNGSGATIKFGGASYNIDQTKLSTATNEFVTHLGKIAGSGSKVNVGGTEYDIGSDKVAGAVADLEIVLGNVHSEDEEVQMPEKNEYGFYFNVPYVGQDNSPDYPCTYAYIFYDNGDMVEYYDYIGSGSEFQDGVTELLCDGWANTVDYDNLDGEYSDYIFSEDGKTVKKYYDEYTATVAPQIVEHGIYFGETYVSQDGETFIPYESDKVVFSNWLGEQSIEGWKSHGHYGKNYAVRVHASIDGTIVYAGSRYDVIKAYYLNN